jgi:hypothetical protein
MHLMPRRRLVRWRTDFLAPSVHNILDVREFMSCADLRAANEPRRIVARWPAE